MSEQLNGAAAQVSDDELLKLAQAVVNEHEGDNEPKKTSSKERKLAEAPAKGLTGHFFKVWGRVYPNR